MGEGWKILQNELSRRSRINEGVTFLSNSTVSLFYIYDRNRCFIVQNTWLRLQCNIVLIFIDEPGAQFSVEFSLCSTKNIRELSSLPSLVVPNTTDQSCRTKNKSYDFCHQFFFDPCFLGLGAPQGKSPTYKVWRPQDCGSGYKMVLVGHMILQKHVMKLPCDFIDRSPLA